MSKQLLSAMWLRTVFVILLQLPLAAQTTAISGPAYQAITSRVTANQQSFSIYQDADSGFNHGFFAAIPNANGVLVNAACIDNAANMTTGCATNPNVLDTTRGTVLSITLTPSTGTFSGVNIQEPQDYPSPECLSPPGLSACGYDLAPAAGVTTASTISFNARSPNGGSFLFGVGNCVTATSMHISTSWTPIVIPLSTLVIPGSGGSACQPQISDLSILFAVQAVAPNQGVILLDNIVFNPDPARQQTSYSFPLSTQTFGVIPVPAPDTTNRPLWPIPPDQVNRNATSIYESSLALIALLARRQGQDLVNAKFLADTFHAALYNDNHGDPVPTSPNSTQGCYGGVAASQCGLHDDYESGDLALNSTQPPPEQGQAGDDRLAGFGLPLQANGTYSNTCGSSNFCLVNDGASGGNNAYAILGLLAAYRQFKNVQYLNDAITIGNWIMANLRDTSQTGFGGYFTGYSAGGTPKTLSHSKSVENNADIFAAFTQLAAIETQLGNSAAAASWNSAAQTASTFVCSLYDQNLGGFDAGTLSAMQKPVWGNQTPAQGVCPNAGRQSGDDIPNTCDFLDSDTFTTLALAGSSQCGATFDWRKPIEHVLSTFLQPSVTANGQTLQGFNIVATPSDNLASGIAWEFTGQVVDTLIYLDFILGQTTFLSQANSYLQQIAKAQTSDPFGDNQGLVASTLQGVTNLIPLDQCLATPYQCIPERVGLAATAWGIFAEQGINPEVPLPPLTATTTVLVSSSNPSIAGQSVTLTALVSSSAATGTVTFMDGSILLGTVALNNNLNSGTATLAVSTLSAGTHLLTALYSSDSNYAGSSGTLTQTVTPASYTISGQVIGLGSSIATINVTGSQTTSTTSAAGNYSITLAAGGTYTVAPAATDFTFAPVSQTFANLSSNQTMNFTAIPSNGLELHTVTPCRVVDTRPTAGFPPTFGPPTMSGGMTRSFPIPSGSCGISSTAIAYSFNVTVVPKGYLGFLTIWPTGQPQPNASTLNSYSGTVVSNAAIVPAGTGGAVSVYVTDSTDVIIDINGYFEKPTSPDLEFYTATPCRVVDTRTGQTGQPLAGGKQQTFPISGECGIPATAGAYALNFTAIPAGYLGYLSAWPAGQPQPNVSTLNSYLGTVVSNAAIVPAGTNGAINVYVTDTTHLAIDSNGYFAPPVASGLKFYPVSPCRVADTRSGGGFSWPFGPPTMSAGETRVFPIPSSSCGIPSAAGAYSLNVTVVPAGYLGYLTIWPTGQPMPVVSTLNSYLGTVVANAAIVNAGNGANGAAISIYVTDTTDVLFDINGYFAP